MRKVILDTPANAYHTKVCFSKSLEVEAPSPSNGNKMLLKNVRIVEEGPARGHGVWLDSDFITKTVALAQGRKIKSRLGHPNMCKESMGTLVGHYENFSVQKDETGTYAIADLHLSTASKKSPHGPIADYISELSQEYPEMFGNSIEFVPGKQYFKTDKGVNIYYIKGQDVTSEGETYDAAKHGVMDEEKLYIEIAAFENSDLVDEPAATSELFGKSFFSKIAAFLGGGYTANKKTILLKKLLQELDNMQAFDIKATTTDGTSILIITENAFIGTGDQAQDYEGNALPDGDYAIETSDSGQGNITITVMGGTITNVGQTPMAQEAEAAPAAGEPLSREQAADAELLKADIAKLKLANTNLTAALSAANEKIEQLSKLPAKAPEVVVEQPEHKTNKFKKEEPTPYAWLPR